MTDRWIQDPGAGRGVSLELAVNLVVVRRQMISEGMGQGELSHGSGHEKRRFKDIGLGLQQAEGLEGVKGPGKI